MLSFLVLLHFLNDLNDMSASIAHQFLSSFCLPSLPLFSLLSLSLLSCLKGFLELSLFLDCLLSLIDLFLPLGVDASHIIVPTNNAAMLGLFGFKVFLLLKVEHCVSSVGEDFLSFFCVLLKLNLHFLDELTPLLLNSV